MTKTKLTEKQKTELANAAKFSAASATDSPFWAELQQHLEDSHAKRQAQIEPRKLKENY
jgi:ribosomal protein L18E